MRHFICIFIALCFLFSHNAFASNIPVRVRLVAGTAFLGSVYYGFSAHGCVNPVGVGYDANWPADKSTIININVEDFSRSHHYYFEVMGAPKQGKQSIINAWGAACNPQFNYSSNIKQRPVPG